jgi:hypothetical protein
VHSADAPRQSSDDLNSVGELYSKDDFRQLVIAIETTPAFFGGLNELEDHRQRGLVRRTVRWRTVAQCDQRVGEWTNFLTIDG